MAVKKKIGHNHTATFAVRMWVEVDDISAATYEQAVEAAKTLAVADLIDMEPGATILDSYIELVGVTDNTALDKVGS